MGRGVRQGCLLSLLLFIIYDEAMVREVCHECAIGIIIIIIATIRFISDSVHNYSYNV